MKLKDAKEDIQKIGKLLWKKDLASGLNGNISRRVDQNTIAITGTSTCLGLLNDEDIVHIDLDGNVLGEGKASSEKPMHTQIYKKFPEVETIIHTHTPYINGFFVENDAFDPRIFEAKLYLGEVPVVPQETPIVTEVEPVLEAFDKNKIVVLKKHGVIAAGKTLFDCFVLIQNLEEAIKTEMVARVFKTK